MEGGAIIVKKRCNTTSSSLFCIYARHKYNFFNRTIPTMKNHMKNSEDVLRNHFTPAITDESLISEHLQQLIALLMRLGRMAVTNPHLNTEAEDNASRLLTGDAVDHTISQNTENKTYKERISGIKNNIKKGRTEAGNTNQSRFTENISKDKKEQKWHSSTTRL